KPRFAFSFCPSRGKTEISQPSAEIDTSIEKHCFACTQTQQPRCYTLASPLQNLIGFNPNAPFPAKRRKSTHELTVYKSSVRIQLWRKMARNLYVNESPYNL
ncbi:MAG: hypothetical protein LBC93_02550, partial [Synergistaceae bacterium]|nr:hypothetical protein [Synergistaceae bacterium]